MISTASGSSVEPRATWRRPGADESATPPVTDSDNDRTYEIISRRLKANRFSLIEIPANILRIISVMTDPDFSYPEVSELVARSPVLTAEFLRTANSVALSRGTTMTDVRVVLPRLGQKRIRSVLYLHSLKLGLANHPLFRDVATEIVDHSIRVAAVAGTLAGRYYRDRDHASQAGLLHDIGKLAILRELANTPMASGKGGGPLTEESFGDTLPRLHQQAGAMLAKAWQLEPGLTYAIGHHHDLPEDDEQELPEGADVPLAAIVSLSDAIAHAGERADEGIGLELVVHPGARALNIPENMQSVAYLDDLVQSG